MGVVLACYHVPVGAGMHAHAYHECTLYIEHLA